MIAGPDVAVRLANEGVPIGAIARATGHRYDDILCKLKDAIADGSLIALPASDWKHGSTREDRATKLATAAAARCTPLALRARFKISNMQALLVLCMMQHELADFDMLTTAAHSYDNSTSVKVQIHRARHAMAAHGIALQNIHGVGYCISPEHKAKVLALIDPQFSPARSEPERPTPVPAEV